ncbi:MAG: hypothetical protein M1825_003899 [Sarcosagium campestre]|nr:MAG: hypothetical protein M1825_003899 [Sarcosagium campestre]
MNRLTRARIGQTPGGTKGDLEGTRIETETGSRTKTATEIEAVTETAIETEIGIGTEITNADTVRDHQTAETSMMVTPVVTVTTGGAATSAQRVRSRGMATVLKVFGAAIVTSVREGTVRIVTEEQAMIGGSMKAGKSGRGRGQGRDINSDEMFWSNQRADDRPRSPPPRPSSPTRPSRGGRDASRSPRGHSHGPDTQSPPTRRPRGEMKVARVASKKTAAMEAGERGQREMGEGGDAERMEGVIDGNDEIAEDDEDAQMKAMLGFGGFESTKQKKVPGNDIYAVRKEKKTEYRQYMNRVGGFNRPLSPSHE